jgi:hypothetical protein
MDADRFDDVIRTLTASPSRRTVLGLTLGGTLGSLLGIADADAKKKKRKKKKKCKGKKKCGKKCIPLTSCCTSADCGGGGATCQNGTCACPAGEKNCQGACIPEIDCCTNADCGGGDLICEDGGCVCGGGALDCSGSCCQPDDEICKQPDAVCQSGGCPVTDFCSDIDFYICEADGCACVTSINAASACTDFATAECIECASDAACVMALGQPAVCVPQGEFCEGLCPDIVTGFCAPIGCSSNPLSAGRRGRGRGGRLTFRK